MLLRCRRFWRTIKTHLEADLTNGLIDFLVKVGGIVDQKCLGFNDAGDGGGGQADGAEDAGKLVEISCVGARLDEPASEDADEGDLFGETLDIGVFDTREVALVDAAGIKAVLESIEVAGLTARVAGSF